MAGYRPLTASPRAGERGFTTAQLVLWGVVVAGFFWFASSMVHRGNVARAKSQAFSEMRQLWMLMLTRGEGALGGPGGSLNPGYPSAGPWPADLPMADPLPWGTGGNGFGALGWEPRLKLVPVQFRVDGWATGYVVSASGDLDRDGAAETWTARGGFTEGVFKVEGPVPYTPPPPPESAAPAP